jgi:hypothetical protein
MGTELLAPAPVGSGHDWQLFDERHRACSRCGLRLFYSDGAAGFGRGWLTVDHAGVPSRPMLNGAGGLASCSPKARIGEAVFIAYSGDPDRYPGCERVQHRPPAEQAGAIVDFASIRPACGRRCAFWELGPARYTLGWTWCQKCFPGRSPPHIELTDAQLAAREAEDERNRLEEERYAERDRRRAELARLERKPPPREPSPLQLEELRESLPDTTPGPLCPFDHPKVDAWINVRAHNVLEALGLLTSPLLTLGALREMLCVRYGGPTKVYRSLLREKNCGPSTAARICRLLRLPTRVR